MIAKSHGGLKGTGMAIAGIIVGIVMLLPLPAATARIAAHKQLCASNLKQLGIAMREYAADNNNRYPTADKWCDLLKPYYKDSCVLTCYSFEEQEQLRRYYALNQLAEPNSPPDTVLLFDSKGQRNCSGGPELLSTDNHGHWYNGSNILFNDGSVKFIKSKNINSLRWTPKQ